MRLSGFPEPSYIDNFLRRIAIITSDRSMLTTFLNAVKQASPEVSEIEAEIVATLWGNPGASAEISASTSFPHKHVLNLTGQGSPGVTRDFKNHVSFGIR